MSCRIIFKVFLLLAIIYCLLITKDNIWLYKQVGDRGAILDIVLYLIGVLILYLVFINI